MDRFVPFLVFWLYVAVRKYLIARAGGRLVEAKIAGATVLLLLAMNIYTIVPMRREISLILFIPSVVVSVVYFRDLYLVKKGKLKPDKVPSTKSSDQMLLETFVVFILSFIICKMIGIKYFNNFLGIPF